MCGVIVCIDVIWLRLVACFVVCLAVIVFVHVISLGFLALFVVCLSGLVVGLLFICFFVHLFVCARVFVCAQARQRTSA